MPKEITPCLWFDGRAEEALNFYISLFPNSKVLDISRWGENGPGEPGTILTADFELNGRQFQILNGGNAGFTFNESISLSVGCETQEEVNELWDKLTADGGEESQCGWLKDKYGLSWQIYPAHIITLFKDPDTKKADAAMQAMMKMSKIELMTIQEAYDNA